MSWFVINHPFFQEKERARDLEQASKFCENLCNDFVSIASSSESAGKLFIIFKGKVLELSVLDKVFQ